MNRTASAALKWHPFLVLVAYACLIAGYHRYLDSGLNYVRPQMPAAPEDILGFGFWIPWLIVAVWLAMACLLSYRLGLQRRVWYWLPLLCGFGFLSIIDFCLFVVLERQVLAG